MAYRIDRNYDAMRSTDVNQHATSYTLLNTLYYRIIVHLTNKQTFLLKKRSFYSEYQNGYALLLLFKKVLPSFFNLPCPLIFLSHVISALNICLLPEYQTIETVFLKMLLLMSLISLEGKIQLQEITRAFFYLLQHRIIKA